MKGESESELLLFRCRCGVSEWGGMGSEPKSW